MAGFFNPHSMEKGGKGTPNRITKCGKCGLASKCFSPKMEPTGSGKYRVLFVGESPGETEDKQGRQFIGDSGKILRKVMKEIGYGLDDCWTTNSVICHPPKNKIEPYMISCCRPSLIKTIEKLRPNVIVTLGLSALESILKDIWARDVGSISRWVGWNIPLAEYNAWLCPTYHSAYLLRREKDVILRNVFKNHLEKAMSLKNTTPKPILIKDLENKIEIVKSTGQAKKLLLQLAQKQGFLAWDYETTGLKPDRPEQRLKSVSFCLNGRKTFAFLLKPSLFEYLSPVLKNPRLKKVASNLKFEERWTISKLGHKVKGWHWDTMLVAHCIDNRPQITSVKFQAFVLFGIADYDSHIKPYLKAKTANGLNRIDEIGTDDILMYNGLDSLIEFMVMERQKETMKGTTKQ